MALTKVDAINACLRGIGLAPVVSEDIMNMDSQTALEVVDQVSRDIQSRGWWFNKEANWEITPDNDGQIKVPNNTLSVVTWGTSRNVDLVLRGDRVYDMVNHTLDLSEAVNKDGNITFEFIMELPYEDLPPAAQYSIMYTARRLFAQDIDGDVNKWRFQSVDEERAEARLQSIEMRNQKFNHMNNPDQQLITSLTAGPNGGRFRDVNRANPRRRFING